MLITIATFFYQHFMLLPCKASRRNCFLVILLTWGKRKTIAIQTSWPLKILRNYSLIFLIEFNCPFQLPAERWSGQCFSERILALESAQIIYQKAKLKSEDGEEFIRTDPKFYAITQRSNKMSENYLWGVIHTNLSLFQFFSSVSSKVALLSPPILILHLFIL